MAEKKAPTPTLPRAGREKSMPLGQHTEIVIRGAREHNLKDIDLTNIRYWFEEFKLLVVKHPNELRLDTTRSKPEETAKKIVAHARRLAR